MAAVFALVSPRVWRASWGDGAARLRGGFERPPDTRSTDCRRRRDDPRRRGIGRELRSGTARRRSASRQCFCSWFSDVGRDHPASQCRHRRYTSADLDRRACRCNGHPRRRQRPRSRGRDQRPVLVRSVALGFHGAGRCVEEHAGIQLVPPYLIENRQSDGSGGHAAWVVRLRRVACDRAGRRNPAQRSVWWLGLLGSRPARGDRAGGRGPRRQQRSLWCRCGRRRHSGHHSAAQHARGSACARRRLDRDGTRVNAHGVVRVRRTRAVCWRGQPQ